MSYVACYAFVVWVAPTQSVEGPLFGVLLTEEVQHLI